MKHLILISILLWSCNVFSQDDSRRVTEKLEHGAILSSSTGRFFDGKVSSSNKEYDELMFAVYNSNGGNLKEGTFLQSAAGEVKFSSANGNVQKGDYITSSSLSGTGMKALHPGMIIGIALEDSSNDTKLLRISICPHWAKVIP
jgi:hypothetical protein